MTEKTRRHRDRRLTSKSIGEERRKSERREGLDRRGSVRVAIDLWMEELRGDELHFRRSCNISLGGVFFEQSIPHPVGTKVMLRFALPGAKTEMSAQGEVTSASKGEAGLGMGVRFSEISDEHRQQLQQFIDDVTKRRGA